MRIIEADQHGVYDITDLPRSRPVRSPVEPDPLAPPTVTIPRWQYRDETFTGSADHYRRQALIDQMMIARVMGDGWLASVRTNTTNA